MVRRFLGSNVTFKIILINLIFFLVVYSLTFYYRDIINYVALRPVAVLEGRNLWTIVSSMFMHANFFHLFVNMFSLYFLGSFLERIIGSKRFLFVYLGAGIIGSIFFILSGVFFQNLNIAAVGASGAVFGLGGMLAVLTPRLPVYIMLIPIQLPMWFGITFALAILWILSITAGLPIGNSAHLGGLIVGLIYGFYLRKKHKKKIAMLGTYFK